ncbi:MAG TPA: flagellar biosynthetic protein FliP, partial [Sulfitobacter sp.]|nr:flagellar biosynthetic protein FliP [Sulfitobacter sp.]
MCLTDRPSLRSYASGRMGLALLVLLASSGMAMAQDGGFLGTLSDVIGDSAPG